MEAFIKSQQQALDARLGVQLTSQDRVDLYLWNRQFILPKASYLQPVLSEYLEYLEDQRNGRHVISNKTRVFGLMLFGVAATFSLLALIADPVDRLRNGLHVIFFGFFTALYVPLKDGGSNLIYRLLSGRQTRNIVTMRKQLSSK